MVAHSISVDSERLSGLIGLGYELPLGSEPSSPEHSHEAARAFVDEAARVFGCRLATLEYDYASEPGCSLLVAGGLEGFEEAFHSMRALNVEDDYLSRMRAPPQGTILLGSEILGTDEMRRSPSYIALAKPWQLEHFLIACVLNRDGSAARFGLARAADEVPFIDADKDLLRRLLLSHLTRSLTLQHEAGTARRSNALLEAFFHRAPSGIVIFDPRGRAIVASDRSSAIFAANDGLRLVDGKLRAIEPSVQVALDAALAGMLDRAAGMIPEASAPVAVPRRNGRRPYQVTFSALGWPDSAPHGHTDFAVVATIREQPELCRTAELRATYGLTDAESRLCQALAGSRTLLEAAQSLAVSRNTAKTHLARIFDKTGVRSQGALMRLLVADPPH